MREFQEENIGRSRYATLWDFNNVIYRVVSRVKDKIYVSGCVYPEGLLKSTFSEIVL